MAANVVAYVDEAVREGGVDSAIELAPIAEVLRGMTDEDAINLELTPVTADKIIVHIDGKVREGGADSAIELAPLAKALKEALADFRAEPEGEGLEAFARDEDLSAIAQDVANHGIIDATEDEVSVGANAFD
jgi:hypothetical protein